jgi:hypothetical protein
MRLRDDELGILDLTSKVLGWFIEQAKKDVQDYNTRKLIREACSEQPSIKIFARAKLKKDYPNIYSELDVVKT